MNTYINGSKADLIQNFGQPVRSQSVSGVELLTFFRDRTYLVAARGPSSHTYKRKTKHGYTTDTYFNPGEPAHYVERNCEVTFRLKRGRVIDWSSQGNDCCDE